MTIHLIAGLARPDRGSIVLDGRVLVDTAAHFLVPAYRRQVGLVFQDAQLFPHLSVRQNLMFGGWFALVRSWADFWQRPLSAKGYTLFLSRVTPLRRG